MKLLHFSCLMPRNLSSFLLFCLAILLLSINASIDRTVEAAAGDIIWKWGNTTNDYCTDYYKVVFETVRCPCTPSVGCGYSPKYGSTKKWEFDSQSCTAGIEGKYLVGAEEKVIATSTDPYPEYIEEGCVAVLLPAMDMVRTVRFYFGDAHDMPAAELGGSNGKDAYCGD